MGTVAENGHAGNALMHPKNRFKTLTYKEILIILLTKDSAVTHKKVSHFEPTVKRPGKQESLRRRSLDFFTERQPSSNENAPNLRRFGAFSLEEDCALHPRLQQRFQRLPNGVGDDFMPFGGGVNTVRLVQAWDTPNVF